MPIEIRELVIKASLTEEAQNEDKGYKALTDEDLKSQSQQRGEGQKTLYVELKKLRKELLEECREMITDMTNRQQR